MNPSDTWTDRQWSVYACEKAIEANSYVGSHGDRIRQLEVDKQDLQNQIDKLNENLLLLLNLVDELQSDNSTKT